MREESDCQKSLIAQMAAASSEAETMTAEKLQVCLGGGQVCLGGGIAGVSQRRDCRCVSEEGAKERREGGEERERERERGRERERERERESEREREEERERECVCSCKCMHVGAEGLMYELQA